MDGPNSKVLCKVCSQFIRLCVSLLISRTLADPSISVRRKVIFLLSSLLHPTSSTSPPPSTQAPADALRITNGPNLSTSTAVTSSDAPNILTPDQAPTAGSDPVFPNSHSANLQNPSRTSTSELTLSALQNHQILDTVISSLVTPLPHGEDGENDGPDADFEEKAVQ